MERIHVSVKRRHQNPATFIRRIVFLLLPILLHSQVVSAKQEDSDNNNNKNKDNKHRIPKALIRLLEGCQQQAVKIAKCIFPKFTLNKHTSTSSVLLFDAPTVVEDFLSADEAAALLQRYQPLLHASLEHDGSSSSTGVKKSQYRTSRSIRLPPLGDALVFEIERRAAALANVSHSWVEDFQLACYDKDELYGLHRDDSVQAVAGRAATVLVYLQPAPVRGGSTLFTMRPLEDEVDLQRRQPLRTEQEALALFRSYCHKPRNHHVVVEAQTGRAVTWKNWKFINDNQLTFLQESTHGACPVLQGQKCVIQQWIAQNTNHQLPLRRDTIRAIVPLGADYAYHHIQDNDNDNDSPNDASTASSPYHQPMNDNNPQPMCLKDVSTQQGNYLTPLCTSNKAHERLEILVDHGPYQNVGALRITQQNGGGFTTSLLASLVDAADGITIMFWMRHNHHQQQYGAWEIVSVALDNGQKTTQLTVRTPPESSSSSSIWALSCRTNDSNQHDAISNAVVRDQNEWVWVVLNVNQHQQNQIRVFSSNNGQLVWQAHQEFSQRQDDDDDANQEPSCTTQDNDNDNNATVQLKFFTPIRHHDQSTDTVETTNAAFFVSNTTTRRQQQEVVVAPDSSQDETSSMDVSFLLIYAGSIDDKEAAQLRRQAVRYDILT